MNEFIAARLDEAHDEVRDEGRSEGIGGLARWS
jgi:hypothetical protein